MTTAEFRARRDAAEERDLFAANVIVAASTLGVIAIWAKYIFEVLV